MDGLTHEAQGGVPASRVGTLARNPKAGKAGRVMEEWEGVLQLRPPTGALACEAQPDDVALEEESR